MDSANTVAPDIPDLIAKISRVRIEPGYIVVELSPTEDGENLSPLRIARSPKSTEVKRNIILPRTDTSKDQRPIQVEQRDRLLRAVAKGRRWLKEIMAGITAASDAIAVREERSKRSVQMMISLAFVAPDIIEAAIVGAIPGSNPANGLAASIVRAAKAARAESLTNPSPHDPNQSLKAG